MEPFIKGGERNSFYLERGRWRNLWWKCRGTPSSFCSPKRGGEKKVPLRGGKEKEEVLIVIFFTISISSLGRKEREGRGKRNDKEGYQR